MAKKGLLIQVKIQTGKRIFILREYCAGSLIKIYLRNPQTEEKELIDESESLEDVIKTLKRLAIDLCWNGFLLYIDKLPPKVSVLKSANEELMIFGKITDEEKTNIKSSLVDI